MTSVGFNRRDNLRFRLELSEPNKIGDSWQSTAIATATLGPEAADVEIQFYLNGNSFGGPVPTDSDGRAIQVFSGLVAGNHFVEAMIVGAPTLKRSRNLPISVGQGKKRPRALELKNAGKNGMHLVNATIVAEDGSGVPGTIRVISGPNRQDFPTDESGVVVIDLDVEERLEEFRFLVLGTAIDEPLRLSGPKLQRVEMSEPSAETLKSPLRAFLTGWRERVKADKALRSKRGG